MIDEGASALCSPAGLDGVRTESKGYALNSVSRSISTAWFLGYLNEKIGDYAKNQKAREKSMDRWNNSCGTANANKPGTCANNCMKSLADGVLDSGNGSGGPFGSGGGYWN